MKNSAKFLIDVLSIVPTDKCTLVLQAPDLNCSAIISLLRPTNDPTLKSILLNGENLNIVTNQITNCDIQDFFHYIAISFKNIKIFEGYDGCEYGVFSNQFKMPEWFRKKYYKSDHYEIADDW